jgi:hypothetical protein
MVWDPAQHGGEIPTLEVNAAYDELFERYTVMRSYNDPPHWQSEIDDWAAKWPDRVLRWETWRIRQMAACLERLKTDVGKNSVLPRDARTLTLDGDPTTLDHVRHARAVRRSGGTIVGKPSPTQKIDLAVADAIAHEAACDAIAAGEHIPKPARSGRAGGFR